ncbi:MAG: SCO family protein [Opitutales bacterium]
MQFYPIGAIFVAGLLCFVACSDSGDETGLGPAEFRFEIVRLDKGTLRVEAKVLAIGSSDDGRFPEEGAVAILEVTRGDAAYLEAGDVCRATVIDFSGNVFRIGSIWPAGPGLMEHLEQANLNLRRDVQRRGRGAAREVGALIPDFAVLDQDGELLDSSFLEGKTTLINFFFTRCPNPLMCPAATQRLQVMLEQASEAGLTNLQVLSLSFDPEHDAPGILKDYAQAYQLDETRFRLGTGPRQALDDLRALVGIATRKDPKLVIDHTFRIVVVDRDRRILTEILGPAWSVENTLARIRKLLQEEGK